MEEIKGDDIQDFLNSMPEDYSVIDSQISIDTQMEYFELSQSLKEKKQVDIDVEIDILNSENSLIDDKKLALIKLASVDDVDAFRAIEKQIETSDINYKNWVLMAYQESRVLLENTLLDQQKVIISTGLGGKNHKLRYFVVFYRENDEIFELHQQKIIHNELIYSLEKDNAELENVSFDENFCKMVVLLPLKFQLKDFFKQVIADCNEFGNFLKPYFILTNVKIMDNVEINEALEKGKE